VWTIRSVHADGRMVPVEAGFRPAMVTFGEDGRFSGSTGCNNFFGQFAEVDAGVVSGPIGSTMMMCPDALMVQERRLLAALEATRAIEVTGDVLVLVDGDGATLVEAQASIEGADDSPR
jgi:heat shock protein HslJ